MITQLLFALPNGCKTGVIILSVLMAATQIFAAKMMIQNNVDFGLGKLVYTIPQPSKFLSKPRATVRLAEDKPEEIFAAFYERTVIPSMPLYRVGATLVRTSEELFSQGEMDLDKLIKLYRTVKTLESGIKGTDVQSRNMERLGNRRWIILKTYTDTRKVILKSVVYTIPVAADTVVIFSLSFWESNKDAAWRERRVPILTNIVKSVRID